MKKVVVVKKQFWKTAKKFLLDSSIVRDTMNLIKKQDD